MTEERVRVLEMGIDSLKEAPRTGKMKLKLNPVKDSYIPYNVARSRKSNVYEGESSTHGTVDKDKDKGKENSENRAFDSMYAKHGGAQLNILLELVDKLNSSLDSADSNKVIKGLLKEMYTVIENGDFDLTEEQYIFLNAIMKMIRCRIITLKTNRLLKRLFKF